MLESSTCPCGSGDSLAQCCGRFLSGSARPQTALQLMRSRYSAYVQGDANYLIATWHVSTRPQSMELAGVQWQGLEVLAFSAGGDKDSAGTVEFRAHYQGTNGLSALHEQSRFVREQGQWYYLDGVSPPKNSAPGRIGRNQACPCGSSKKYKRCCGSR